MSGGGGFMQALQQMNDSGVLQGISNMGATMANAGAPGLGYRGLGAGLASGAAAFGPGMLQGAEQNYQQQMIRQARMQASEFGNAFGGDQQVDPAATSLRNMVPENLRPLMFALGPQEGMKMLGSIVLNRMNPLFGQQKVGPGENIIGPDGKPIYSAPFPPKESYINTEAGTIGPNGQGGMGLIAPKPPEITAVGPYAYGRNFQSGKSGFLAPPGANGGVGGADPNDPLSVIMAAEGAGKNPVSSAQGIGQFTDQTAQEYMGKYGQQAAADLGMPSIAQAAQGKDGGLGFFRFNPAVQKYMAQKYYQDNVEGPLKAALPNTQTYPADIYASYVLRNDAQPFLQALHYGNPNAPVNSVLPDKVIQSNPSLFVNADGSMASVGQAYQNFGARYIQHQNNLRAQTNPMRFTPESTTKVGNPDGTSIYVPESRAAGAPAPNDKGVGVNISGGAQPTASVTLGGSAPGSLLSATGGLGASPGVAGGGGGAPVEKDQLAKSINQLETLNNAYRQFDPKYLTLPNQVKMSVLEHMDRIGALNPDQQKQLADYTQFQANTDKNAVTQLHDTFGARLTQTEIKRAEPYLPTMEDGPTAYAQKLNQSIDTARNAIMRDSWLQSNGQALTDQNRASINVGDMQQFVRQQAATFNGSLASQGVPTPVRAQRVLQFIGQKFGIVPPDLAASLGGLAQPQNAHQ